MEHRLTQLAARVASLEAEMEEANYFRRERAAILQAQARAKKAARS